MASQSTLQKRPTRRGLRQLLADDHRRIQELAARVLACVDAGDPHGAVEEWPAFEQRLITHMSLEEMLILPRFAEVEPDDAKRLRDEHTMFRTELGHLAVCLELHIARKAMFEILLSTFAMHSAHEEETLYAWAERTLPERIVDTLTRRLQPA